MPTPQPVAPLDGSIVGRMVSSLDGANVVAGFKITAIEWHVVINWALK